MAHATAEINVNQKLKDAGLRPTRQRCELGSLLWGDGGQCRHVNAETLHREAMDAGISVSLATVYNTLHQFTAAGLLREIVVERGCSYFDTNTDPHHHFLHVESGHLEDIPAGLVEVASMPNVPEGMQVDGVDVIVRVKSRQSA